ncbi:MAG: polysaccharide deacetylase family protein [Planctomycetes bacterium]|nr:polysaccharide deacetylase family protein [Planctomycetota bacterium]
MSPTLSTLLAFAVGGCFYSLVPRLVAQRNRWWLAARCRRRRVIALTFDDGPCPVLTRQVLDRLDAAGVPGTFFVLGHRVRGNEDLVMEVRARGHEIGSHGNLHPHHVWSLPWVGALDLRDGRRRLASLLAREVEAMCFRPPYGKLNLFSLLLMRWHRTQLTMWTHDGHDTSLGTRPPPVAIADAIRRAGGGVLLLHDFERASVDSREDVLARLDAVLRLRDEGFRFVRMQELLAPEPAGAAAPDGAPPDRLTGNAARGCP